MANIEYELGFSASEIDEKLGKIKDTDQTYNPDSENPQSGKAVAEAIQPLKNALYKNSAGTKTYTYDDIVWTEGKIQASSGEFQTQGYYWISDFIEVTENTEIIYDTLRSPSVYHAYIIFYDKDKGIVSALTPSTNGEKMIGSTTVPSNSKYVRVSTYKDNSQCLFNNISISGGTEILVTEELTEELNQINDVVYSIFKGKKAVFLGDSITQGMSPEYTPGHTGPAEMSNHNDKTYWQIVGEKLGLNSYIGYGITGTCITKTASNSGLDFVERFPEMDNDADLVCVFGGTNDFGLSISLGTINDLADMSTSFYSALRYLIIGLIKKYPNARIIFCTPLPRFEIAQVSTMSALNSARKGKYTKVEENGKWHYYDWETSAWVEDDAYNQALADGTATEDYADEYDHSYLIGKIKNNKGNTLSDYVNAIKEVCAMYSIPICDFNSNSLIYPYTRKSRYDNIGDGLHPHSNQHKIMGRLLANAINEKC